MPSGPAARVADSVAHPAPPVLTGGMGSTNVIIGNKPAWRGVPLAAAGGLVSMAAATTVRMNAAMARTAAGDPSGAVDLAACVVQMSQAMAGTGADVHTCGFSSPNPHVGGVVITGSPTVMINNFPACRMGDTIVEAGPPNVIASGCMSVIIGDIGMGCFSSSGM